MTSTFTPLARITVPDNRQRTEGPPERHVAELMQDIFREGGPGLINPVTLRDGTVLVAGECRTAAVKLGYKMGKLLWHAGQLVPKDCIPTIDFGQLTKLQQMEVEYSENALREDLHYLDKARAMAALHELRTAQKAKVGEKQTFAQTAQELVHEPSPKIADKVAKSVELVRMVKDHPELAKAASFKEATKIMARITTTAQNVKLAEAVGKVASSSMMRLFNEECCSWMAKQPAEQYDVILTDPPYGMGADSFGDAAGRMAGIDHEYKDTADHFHALLQRCAPEFFRLAKPEAHLYLWCDIDHFLWLRDLFAQAGWKVHRTPLINIKPEGGRVPWADPAMGPRRAYEICLYAVKGNRTVNAIKPDVFESRLVEGNLGHGAQKPVQAYVELLSRSVRPGDKVLDAFAGTGTIFPAAHAMKCYADGCEMEAAAYGIGINRIKELK